MELRAMQDWNSFWRAVIEGEVEFQIPITLQGGDRIGTLRPVTKSILTDADTISALTRWRNRYREFFLTQFDATDERTARWLETTVLNSSDRMLFLVYADEELIGHYGFRDLTPVDAQLDNLLRGERGGHPLTMQRVIAALSEWLFDEVRVEVLYGYVLANNPYALKNHLDLGFRRDIQLPLTQRSSGVEVEWLIGAAGESSPDGKYYQKVVLTSSRSG